MINHAIKIDSISNILVCPMHCWVHGTVVKKCPKFLSASPIKDGHALLVHDPDGYCPLHTILLSLNSITRYFEARCPSLSKYEDMNIPEYHLMSESPPWDPSNSLYSLQEDDMIDYRGCLIAKLSTYPHSPDITVSSVVLASYKGIYIIDDENFAAVLDHHVKVDMTMVVQTAHLTTTQGKLAIDSNMLAWHWGIPLHKAKRTVQCTTQLGEEYCKSDPAVQIFHQQLHAPILSFAPHYLHRQHVCQYPVQERQQVCLNLQFWFWMVGRLPYEDKMGGTGCTVLQVPAWECSTFHGHGQLKGTDPWQVPPETLRCHLWEEDHRALLPLAKCCLMGDQETQERGW